MAKIVEDVVIIKFSKIVKDSEEGSSVATSDVQAALRASCTRISG
jgi:hypothetical protein